MVCINPRKAIEQPFQGTQLGIEPGALPPENPCEIPTDRVDQSCDNEQEDSILQHGIDIHWRMLLSSSPLPSGAYLLRLDAVSNPRLGEQIAWASRLCFQFL